MVTFAVAFTKALAQEVAKKLLRPVIDAVITERMMARPKLYAIIYRTTSPGGWQISTLFECRVDAECYLRDVKRLSVLDPYDYTLIEVADVRRSW